jgi:hypothetical protein
LHILPSGRAYLDIGERGEFTLHPEHGGDTVNALEQLRAIGHAIIRQCNAEIDRLARQRAHAAVETASPGLAALEDREAA